jgi:transposase
MVTDAQVRLLRRKRMEGKTQEAAAAAAGMSVRAARKWEAGALPSEARAPRTWRTRKDPFEDVWEEDVVPLLERDTKAVLEATTILDLLVAKRPDEIQVGQLRTLQRRVRDWRALHGPQREVFFEQVHPPGREAQLDFTHGTELEVTVGGEILEHLIFELLLSFSGWRYVEIAYGETFEALVSGIQGAFWDLGGVTEIVRMDNLSAATHELRRTGGRDFNARFRDVLDHYRLQATRIRPGRANENGVAERAHRSLKSAMAQALIVRGSSEFQTIAAYRAFLGTVRDQLNRRVTDRIAKEREHLQPLPTMAIPSYTAFHPKVRRWSTIRVGNRTYSVPSRLIGHTVEARQHPDVVEVRYGDKIVETMPRLRGKDEHRIDYRHVIWSLVRKPGAFARYRYREDLFPSITFRRAYDALRQFRGERADVEYVRVLHLAASTLQGDVERALDELLQGGDAFDYAAVKALAAPSVLAVPDVPAFQPNLATYDALLVGGAR